MHIGSSLNSRCEPNQVSHHWTHTEQPLNMIQGHGFSANTYQCSVPANRPKRHWRDHGSNPKPIQKPYVLYTQYTHVCMCVQDNYICPEASFSWAVLNLKNIKPCGGIVFCLESYAWHELADVVLYSLRQSAYRDQTETWETSAFSLQCFLENKLIKGNVLYATITSQEKMFFTFSSSDVLE